MATRPEALSWIDQSSRLLVPGQYRQDGYQFLETVGAGGSLGTGTALSKDLARLRGDYEAKLSLLNHQVETLRAQGMDDSFIANWVVGERLRIARDIRLRQGVGPLVALEIRDNFVYGLGGRTYSNLAKAKLRTKPELAADDAALARELIGGAQRSNKSVSANAMRGAQYVKSGGYVLFVLGAGLTVYDIASAKPQERERVVYEEAGSWAGSYLAAGAAVAIFGLVTGGWGLLAIGIVAGMAGGAGGGLLADKIYYSTHPHLVDTARNTGTIPVYMLQARLPSPSPCPRCHSR